MRHLHVILVWLFALVGAAPAAHADSRPFEVCVPLVEACDCPRRVRHCAPVCQVEFFIAPCPTV